MAKEKSILMLQGNIGNLSFYKTKDGMMVRTKGGVEKKRIMTEPQFARTRENMQEFAAVAKTGKFLRHAVSAFVNKAADSKVSNRMTSILTQLKQLDTAAVRGERHPAAGLILPEGKLLLEGFDFNSNSQLGNILLQPYSTDDATGIMTLQDFVPNTSLLLPKEATHVQFSIAAAGMDAALQSSETMYSAPQNFAVNAAAATLTLDPGGIPGYTDVLMYLILIEFLQEVNGVQYALNNQMYNCLNIVKVK